MPKIKHSNNSQNLLPFSRANIDGIPDSARGVYAYWYRANGKCIYVGKAEKQPIKTRLLQEWLDPHNKLLKLWMKAFGKQLSVCYLPVKRSNISKMERRLIKQFNPETNIIHKRGN